MGALLAAFGLAPAGLAGAAGILTGGSQVGTSFETQYTAPGTQQFFVAESDAQMTFPAGTLKNLRVNVKDTGATGTVTVRLRVNGAATPITCSVTNFGTCTSLTSKVIAENALVSVLIRQTYGPGETLRLNYLFELE